MGEMMVQVGDGWLSFVQMTALGRRMVELGKQNTHWHFNDCGCCVTIHGLDCAYVIGRDGGETFFPGRGCDCDS
jgi:hypothetical protein